MIELDIGKYRQQKGHRDTIVRMRYSPSGRYLVSADKSGQMALWPQTGRRDPRRFDSLPGTLTDVWFSEDEKWLLVGHQGGWLCIYEVPKAKLVISLQLKPDRDEASSILSGTSRPILNYVVMASCPQSADCFFVVLEFRDFFLVRKENFQVTYAGHSPGNIIEQTTMTADGEKVFFGDDLGLIYRYRLGDKTMKVVAEHRERVRAVDSGMRDTVMEAAPGIASLGLSADGRILASTSYDGGVQVWDTDQGPEDSKKKPLASREPRQRGRTRGIGFCPQTSRVALGSDDGLFEIWDFNAKETLCQADCAEGIRSLDVSSLDGTCAIGGKEGTVFLVPRLDVSPRDAQGYRS